MFARTVVLLIVFSLALVNASKHLRTDQSIEKVDIPIDQARGNRAVASFMKAAAKKRANDEKTNSEYFDKLVQDSHAKVFHLAKKGKGALDAAKFHTTAVEGPQSLVTRHRPNGDCSGIISNIHVQDMTACTPFPGTAPPGWEYYRPICATSNGKRGEVFTGVIAYFDNPTCEGEPNYISDADESFPKCGSDPYADYMESPETIGKQCIGRPSETFLQEPGVISAIYNDNTCSTKPTSFSIMRFGGCDLVRDWRDDDGREVDYPTTSKYNSFYYLRFDNCGPEPGSVMISGYSDSSCVRPMFRATTSFGNDFNNCAYTGSFYQFNTCVPQMTENM